MIRGRHRSLDSQRLIEFFPEIGSEFSVSIRDDSLRDSVSSDDMFDKYFCEVRRSVSA